MPTLIADASRVAALLVGSIAGLLARLAPCHAGASARQLARLVRSEPLAAGGPGLGALRAILLLLIVHGGPPEAEAALTARDVALVVNRADPTSQRVAAYYRARRGLSSAQVFDVRLPTLPSVTPAEFAVQYANLRARLPEHVQALVLAWVYPYRVGCMSVTTAFAAGFDRTFCAAGCRRTRASPYYDSPSSAPHRDHGWRPAILLGGSDEAGVRKLIDRGLAADASSPPGTAYLVSTSDRARNVRAIGYRAIEASHRHRLRIEIVHTDALTDRDDVMFYFTGRARVGGLDSLGFRPGAIADHLTSAGGRLEGGRQMSALRWLEAGATGTYGSVKEPCNFPQKFPNPEVLMRRYLGGDTLIEAYWKSVHWPGQGVFVGEPLARPFADKAKPMPPIPPASTGRRR